MTERQRWFDLIDKRNNNKIVKAFIEEEWTEEIFFYFFYNNIVLATEMRKLLKESRYFKTMNDFRNKLTDTFTQYIGFKAYTSDNDISPFIKNLMKLAEQDDEALTKFTNLPKKIIVSLNYETLTLKKIQALVKLYS